MRPLQPDRGPHGGSALRPLRPQRGGLTAPTTTGPAWGPITATPPLMEAMGMEPVDLADYERTTVTDQFYGSLFSSSGVRWLAPDHIDTHPGGWGEGDLLF